MGLVSELGYRHRAGKGPQRLARRIATSPGVGAVLARVQAPTDSLVRRLTRGRATLTELLGGLPPLWLTTTGAKSGQQRATPLFGVPLGDDLAVLGTSYGQEKTPGWVYNLEADPRATVAFRDQSCPVIARRADADEESAIWQAAYEIYAGYASYREVIQSRPIKVFVLEVAGIE